MVSRKLKILWIVDFGPRQVACRCKSDANTLIGEMLHRDVKKLVLVACLNQIANLGKHSFLYVAGKNRDTYICAAELRSSDPLTHANHAISGNDDFHGLVAPIWIYDHGYRRARTYSGRQNSGIANDVTVQANKRFSVRPVPREPERVNIIRNGECRIFDKVETVAPISVFCGYVLDDLILFVTHDNADARYTCRKEALDLMVQDG
jgi:hypothetical protein